MIIRYPTGFYRDVIPQDVGVKGNTTYTISNTDPPRTNLVFPKIPIGVVLRQRNADIPSLPARRLMVGALVFSVSSAQRVELGNNSRQYEIGDVLDFSSDSFQEVKPMLVNEITEIRHDLNVLDSVMMGLSLEDTTIIANASLVAQAMLTEQLNSFKQQRVDAEQNINTQQKIINETGKTIAALRAILVQTPNSNISALIEQLLIRQNTAIVARDKSIVDANSYAAQADIVLDQLRSVVVVVK